MDHATIIASIGLLLAIIGLILAFNNLRKHRKQTKLTIQDIRERKHFPQTIHEVMSAQWPGEYQDVKIEYEEEYKEEYENEYEEELESEFIARSDAQGFFITDSKLDENNEIINHDYRTIEQLSDAQISEVEINLCYIINVEEEMNRINDSR